MTYRIILTPSDEGVAASVVGLPGCHSQGRTDDEALANIRDAIREYLDVIQVIDPSQRVCEIEVEA